MNESKLRKGTKYACLKDEDVHTVTGALKQFFRELKTDLIPIEVVKNLPNISLGESKYNVIQSIQMKLDLECFVFFVSLSLTRKLQTAKRQFVEYDTKWIKSIICHEKH